MALLLDTHAFLWFIDDDPKLSRLAVERIGNPAERVVVSVVCAWEIVIKISIGKLTLDRPLPDLWPESLLSNAFETLNVTPAHIFALASLPLHHRDPFDRLLIAQARTENLSIVSADSAFDAYAIERIW